MRNYSKVVSFDCRVDQLLGDIEGIILSISPESNSVDLEELPNTILILRNKFKVHLWFSLIILSWFLDVLEYTNRH